MKIVIDETYDYLYNVWSYERGYVYDVEEVPRSGFYHYWHGANLDVIPHGNAHPASAKEIRSLPSGETLHKGKKTVTVSMDSVLHHRDERGWLCSMFCYAPVRQIIAGLLQHIRLLLFVRFPAQAAGKRSALV